MYRLLYIDMDTLTSEFEGTPGVAARNRLLPAHMLRETPLSLDHTIMDLNEERVIVQATVHDSSELRWWLLGFGVQVEVIAPIALRREMQGTALAMAELYNGGEPPSTRKRKKPA